VSTDLCNFGFFFFLFLFFLKQNGAFAGDHRMQVEVARRGKKQRGVEGPVVDVQLAEKLLLSKQFESCLCVCYSLLYELSVSSLPLSTPSSSLKYAPADPLSLSDLPPRPHLCAYAACPCSRLLVLLAQVCWELHRPEDFLPVVLRSYPDAPWPEDVAITTIRLLRTYDPIASRDIAEMVLEDFGDHYAVGHLQTVWRLYIQSLPLDVVTSRSHPRLSPEFLQAALAWRTAQDTPAASKTAEADDTMAKKKTKPVKETKSDDTMVTVRPVRWYETQRMRVAGVVLPPLVVTLLLLYRYRRGLKKTLTDFFKLAFSSRQL
jgi:hypothetical protein